MMDNLRRPPAYSHHQAIAPIWQATQAQESLSRCVTIADYSQRARSADLLPDVLDVDQGRDGADLGVLRAL